MADISSTFNLLYKVDAQKTFVDKLYDFVIGPGRLIVVGVMLVIIAVFSYRFFLDSTLRDERKKMDSLKRQVENFVIPNEKKLQGSLTRTENYAKYSLMYRDGGSTEDPTSVEGKLHYLSTNYDQIMSLKNAKFVDSITVSEYSVSYSNDRTTVKITGATSTFIIVDQFVTELKKLDTVEDAASTTIGASKQDKPRYQIDIKLKK